MSALRAILFYAGYIVLTVVWGSLSVLVGWTMPYRTRFEFVIGIWTRSVLRWLTLTCGIRVNVEGRENIPQKACVVLSKHESTWETLYLQSLFAPQATLIKRELLWIPFFGWAFALLKPIAIDRSNPRQALRKFIDIGRARLDDDIWVVLFPEGTRTEHGELGKFQAGGAALASAAECQLLVVAHDAGRYWPAHRFGKNAGTVQLRIAPPIDCAGLSTKEINVLASETMAQLMKDLPG